MRPLWLAVILLAGLVTGYNYLALEVVFFIMVFTWDPRHR